MIANSIPQRRIQLAIVGIVALSLFLLYFRRELSSASNELPYLSGAIVQSGFLEHVQNRTLGVLLNFFSATSYSFQKIFVLNLPSRTDHKDAVSLAAALSNLQLDWIDGVKGADVLDKVLPPGDYQNPPDSVKGCWRAHMKALLTVVQQIFSTALIMEDDNFALSSRALIQPISSNPSKYTDPTFPAPEPEAQILNISLERVPRTIEPSSSAYGDNWDLLWLGHCGMQFPKPDNKPPNPLGRVVYSNDLTVPEKQFIHFQWGSEDLTNDYPTHTRVVHHATGGVCSLAYAVSQRGARRLLYELGFCNGANRRVHGTCLTVQPQLFQHHRPRGARKGFSDISNHGEDWNEKPYSKHIQWSVRKNFRKMVMGETDYVDQWPAGGKDNGLPSR
ncbi:uncharacterized protein BDZ99DRAFT_511140 [Mytilinidion resinicola]|uniref:Glycosyltransferase family 25 protein n=1 Tax=Mytilinidion resinicola TaxID=574789 RepID=A0A6A6YAZ0_9PEZI|nr:uncharacterized protein BDZ99DRAFT_511140 [Mytilinidion resinicola]KAF2805738.1 hypothetical protein BDZ99DRAFT_511140 [Mytilinidion resinicola]